MQYHVTITHQQLSVFMKSALIRLNLKGNEMNTITKAMDVEQAYDAANYDNISSEGCYSRAVAAAHELGGVEVFNSNDGNSSISFAPTRTFEFDDSSSAQVTYGGVFVIAPNQPY